MCELFCLTARHPTRATFSLDTFARRGTPGGSVNIDGWGIALHDGRAVRLYKEPEPAGESAWLAFVGQRHPASRIIVSHIRRATIGPITLANTQPFSRELGARTHVFAHNGHLEGLAGRYRNGERFRPVGDTDSELAFCVLADRLAPLWRGDDVPALERRFEIVARFADELRALGPANFIYSDGDAVFAQGDRRTQASGRVEPPGLWLLHRACASDRDGLQGHGVTIEATGGAQEITLLASVPLTDEGWRALDEGELVAVRDGQVVATRRAPAFA
jgi:glutamine amidotransferase